MNWLKKLIGKFLLKIAVKKIKKEVNMNFIKSGWKTTEFWLGIASIIATVWFGIKGIIPADLMVKIMAGVAMVYSIARAIVKFTPTLKDDEILKKLEELFKK